MADSMKTSDLEECGKVTVEDGESLEVDGVSDGKPVSVTTSPARKTVGDPLDVPEENVCSGSGFFITKPPWLEEELRFKTDYYDKKRSVERERRRALRCPERKLQSGGTSTVEEKSAAEVGTLKEEEKAHDEVNPGDTATAQGENVQNTVLDSVQPIKRARETVTDGDESDDNIGKPKRPKPAIYIPILRGKFLKRPRK